MIAILLSSLRVTVLFLLAAKVAFSQGAQPAPLRDLEIPLKAGWNSVFLEVGPTDASPDEVFSGLPIDKVATLFGNPAPNQFVTDPEVDLGGGNGWAVWYAAGSPEAFLKSLDAIPGGRAYLVHAREACTWRVRGAVRAEPPAWRPDAYNLVGFAVRTPGGPTFAEFFAASPAHRGQAIYRMVDGRWKKVLQPSNEVMRAGEAFWIYCKGASDFQGPLTVETATGAGVVLGAGDSRVVLRNRGPHPLTARVEHLEAEGPAVPLSILVRGFGDPAAPIRSLPVAMPGGPWSQALPPLESGASLVIPLALRETSMSRPRQVSLLKITTDLGTETWLPVIGIRDDLGD